MLAVSRKPILIPLLLMMTGLAIVVIAGFADRLGVDPSPGWGRGRIILLIIGSLTAAFAIPGWRFLDRTLDVEGRIQTLGNRLVAIFGPHEDAGLIHAAGGLRSYRMALPIGVIVLLIYVWFVSSGTWSRWTSQTRYYADLARGFQKGHLYLAIKVPASLIKSTDPYEPVAPFVSQGPIDYSYYQGRYYMPWGPVPALIVLLYQEAIHRWLGDLPLAFGFLCGLFLVQCLLLIRIWDRSFQTLPRWLLWMCVLLAGLAGPATYMLNNYNAARIYDAAVLGGQFFLLSGFLTALITLQRWSFRWAARVDRSLLGTGHRDTARPGAPHRADGRRGFGLGNSRSTAGHTKRSKSCCSCTHRFCSDAF